MKSLTDHKNVHPLYVWILPKAISKYCIMGDLKSKDIWKIFASIIDVNLRLNPAGNILYFPVLMRFDIFTFLQRVWFYHLIVSFRPPMDHMASCTQTSDRQSKLDILDSDKELHSQNWYSG